MSNTDQSISLDIISEVIQCCRNIGHEKTLHGIRLLSLNDEKTAVLSNMIIDIICTEMPISRQALLSGSGRGKKGRGRCNHARMYLYVLHHQFIGSDCEEIAKMFAKKYRTVWGKLEEFKRLNPDHRFDIEVMQKYNTICAIVNHKFSKL